MQLVPTLASSSLNTLGISQFPLERIGNSSKIRNDGNHVETLIQPLLCLSTGYACELALTFQKLVT
jgi:hypothetical protein